jgi:hypothetical protein
MTAPRCGTPTLASDLRSAIGRLIGGAVSDGERLLVREAFESGHIVLATGERSVSVGGSFDGAIVTGDNSLVISLDRATVETIREAFAGLFLSRRYQLPRDLADFTGRTTEVAQLVASLGAATTKDAIWAICGMGGTGKSALAIHVGHCLVEHYPDGQLFINLLGLEQQPVAASQAMARIIRSLEPAAFVPRGESEIAACYRSTLTGKRVLIVLDNVRDAAHVKPLIPPEGCAVIVTARRMIKLPDIERIELGVLNREEACEFLRSVIAAGPASSEAIDQIAQLCGYLPLALRIAGSFLDTHPDWQIEEYIQALTDRRERLQRLRLDDDPELDVAASLRLSEAQLDRELPELLIRWQLLSIFPATFDRIAAASVWEVGAEEARDALSALVTRSLVFFDPEHGRYHLHDLMRATTSRGVERGGLSEEQMWRAAFQYVAHYRRVLETADTLYREGRDSTLAGLNLFDLERANIEKGYAAVATQFANNAQAAHLCLAYYNAGANILALRHSREERVAWAERALLVARQLNDSGNEASALCNWAMLADGRLREPRLTIETMEEAQQSRARSATVMAK